MSAELELARHLKRGKPPANPIIGQKRADEWDRDIKAILDATTLIFQVLDGAQVQQKELQKSINKLETLIKVRNIITTILLIVLVALNMYNVLQFNL